MQSALRPESRARCLTVAGSAPGWPEEQAEDDAGLQSGNGALHVPAAKLPRPLRKDPRPRHLDGSAPWARLLNRDPNKHYCYVNKADVEAVANYEAAGYDVEVLTEKGVRPAGGRTGQPNQPIEMRGMVLYSVPMERYRQIEMEGADGDSGQLEADRLEDLIVDRRGFDPLRGMHSRFGVSVKNEIERPENEVGA